MKERWSIVLAGGQGARLSHLTRSDEGRHVPKQFWSLDGELSLLESTLERAFRLSGPERTVVVVLREHAEHWRRQLGDLPARNVVVQPSSRGTAAAVALGALRVFLEAPQAVAAVLPSDHTVQQPQVLQRATIRALELAERGGFLALLGITPDRDDEEYGFLVPASDGGELRRVARFVENPTRLQAAVLRDEGALWSSFLMVSSVRTLLGSVWTTQRDLIRGLWRGMLPADDPAAETLDDVYAELPALDFSADVLEDAPELLRVLRVPPCGWSDLGTEARLARCLAEHCRPEEASLRAGRAELDFALALSQAA